MQETPNLKLQLFERADGEVKFLDYRLAQSENFKKIDEAVSQSSSNIEALETTVSEISQKQIEDKQELTNTIGSVKAELVAEDVAIKDAVTALTNKVDSNYNELTASDASIREEVVALDLRVQESISATKQEIVSTISGLEEKHDLDFQQLDSKINENNSIIIEELINKADKNHTHTKSEIGLGNVEDYAVATMEEAVEGIVTNKYMTPALVAEAIKWGVANDGGIELKHLIKSSYVETENQKVIDIPFENFDETIHFLELRVGGVPFFHERYTIEAGKIILNDDEVGFSAGKRVDFVITYLEQVAHNRLPVNGKNLLDGSITESKLSQELRDKINNLSLIISTLETEINSLKNK